MRRTALALSLSAVALAAAAVPAALRAEDPPPNAPKPPDTPLPKFENPLSDAEVGETCLYLVKDLSGGGHTSYFEETVLARSGEFVLVETIRTDEKGAKNFGLDAAGSRWWAAPPDFKDNEIQKWKPELKRDEILYVGPEGALKAVRCTRRGIDEPVDLSSKDGPRRVRQIWHSHDVKARGIAKMFPAQGGGERRAISWDKKVPLEECAKRAVKHGPVPEDKPKEEPAMGDEPGMDGGMEDPGMAEPGMAEPGMTEPGMTEPGMDK